MKKLKYLLLLFLFVTVASISKAQTDFRSPDYKFWKQMSIGKEDGTATNPNAWLEIGKYGTSRGFILPRANHMNIGFDAGNFVYDVNTNSLWYCNGTEWFELLTSLSMDPYNEAYIDASFNGSTRALTLTRINEEVTDVIITAQNLGLVGNSLSITGGNSVSLTTTNVNEGTNLYFTNTRARSALSGGTGISYVPSTGVITNTAPDQIVDLEEGAGISITGTYPNFTITNTGGTVSSVGLSMPSIFTVTNSPVTSSGTLTATLNSQSANTVFSTGPSSAVPTFRLLAETDIPNLSASKITSGTIATARLGGGTASSTTALFGDQTYKSVVTSVGLSAPSVFSVSGSPITTSGTLALTFASGQTANQVLATPNGTTGALSLRSLVSGDIPNLDVAKITSGVFSIARGGTGLSSLGTANQLLRVNSGATALEYFTPTFLTANQTITLSGDVTGSGSTAITTTIANDAVTYAKLQNITASRLLGRYTGTNGDAQEISIGTGLNLNSGTGVLTATGSGGTVTSVALSLPSIFSVSGSPITTSGTLTATLATQTANTVFAVGGSTAAPSFQALTAAHIPTLTASKISDFTTAARAAFTEGTGIDITSGVITNTAPDQVISLTEGDNIVITGTYPNFTIEATGGGTGSVTSVAIGSTDLSVSGSPITTSGTITLNVNNDAITYAKMQNMTANRLLGRYTASTGDPQEITIGTGLTLNTSTGVLTSTTGTVTSVGLTSSDITVGGTSPITTSGTFTLTLPTINSNVGTFNNVTVNGKGQVTAASNVSYLTSYTETDPIFIAQKAAANGVASLGANTRVPTAQLGSGTASSTTALFGDQTYKTVVTSESDPIFDASAAAGISGTNITNWTAAYNDKINSAAFTGTSTKTLTLTQQDGGTITANFSDQGITSETDPTAIKNQTSLQTANFNISGNGYIGGNLGVGTTTPEEEVDIRGILTTSQGPSSLQNRTVMSWTTGGGYITGETHNGTSWARASVRIDAVNTLVDDLEVNGDITGTGNIAIDGTITAQGGGFNSLRSLKEDISIFSKNALEIIDHIKLYNFKYKSHKEDQYFGLMADEAPEELLMNNGTAINTYNTLSLLIKAIQELNSRIDKIEKND